MRARQKQFEMRDRLDDLVESESRLRLALSVGAIGAWDYDPINDVLTWDARCKSFFGLSPDAPVTFEGSFVAGLHPDDREATSAAVGRALDPDGNGEYEVEYRTIGHEDGIERWIVAKGGCIFRDGRPVRFLGTVADVSARKTAEIALARSEAALREERRALEILTRTLEEKVAERTFELKEEMANRERAEAALRQSQKMEAVGQLTGGIAHDFNNMLTGVIGSIEILKRRIASGRMEHLDRFMDAAMISAQRAAALTARLLAFSRRQALDSKPTDVNALANSLRELLSRTIGERVTLRFDLEPELPQAVVDANQLESAMLNLVLNARDAMPEGGEITVATRSVDQDAGGYSLEPGRYVAVSVSDTGVGVEPELLDKIFEPFFTTKPLGQGTGLGLSMVYGFVKQTGGDVRVESRVGEGARLTMLLPVATQQGDAVRQEAEPLSQNGNGETVLVVEDEDSVRLLVLEALKELGYNTISASDAQRATVVLNSPTRINLMVSDVGLPGMNGRQLAEVARAGRPNLPILFITAYAENAAIRAGFSGTNMAMITKPFSLAALGLKVAEMLSRRSAQERAAPTASQQAD